MSDAETLTRDEPKTAPALTVFQRVRSSGNIGERAQVTVYLAELTLGTPYRGENAAGHTITVSVPMTEQAGVIDASQPRQVSTDGYFDKSFVIGRDKEVIKRTGIWDLLTSASRLNLVLSIQYAGLVHTEQPLTSWNFVVKAKRIEILLDTEVKEDFYLSAEIVKSLQQMSVLSYAVGLTWADVDGTFTTETVKISCV